MNMYSPYITLMEKQFHNTKINIDIFHIVQLLSKSSVLKNTYNLYQDIQHRDYNDFNKVINKEYI